MKLFHADRQVLQLLAQRPFDRLPNGRWACGERSIADNVAQRLIASGVARQHGEQLVACGAPQQPRLTAAQRAALVSARDHLDITRHLSGRAAFGGFSRTRRTLFAQDFIDRQSEITASGRAAVAQARSQQPEGGQ